MTDWDGTVGYTYDANNRLDSATGADYNYDWIGNRLNPPADPNAMVYDATDKLVTWPGQHQYTYYPTGSLYQQKDSGGTAQKTYTYTGAELLASVTHAGVANPSTMVWDGDANRVSFTSSTGGTTEFVYDPTAGIPAVIQEASPSAYVYYVREPNGALLMRDDGSTFHHYHFDALGSTRMITDYRGNVTDTYAYDAWGNVAHAAYAGSVEQPYQFVGLWGYYSHHQDANLMLLQLGVRFYSPEIGRFTQRDTVVRHTESAYSYADNRVSLLVDPKGRLPEINCPDCKAREKMTRALSFICNALAAGKIDDCPGKQCYTGPKQLKCLKDYCNKGKIQCGGYYCVHENPDWPGQDPKNVAGYAPCEPGKQHPEWKIVICNATIADSGMVLKLVILHEMNHICGVESDQRATDMASSSLALMMQ